jgi:diguanylate cyclase (GGDEF)-like protein
MTRPLTARERRVAGLRTALAACAVALAVAALAHWPAGEWLAAVAGLGVGALFWRAQAAMNRERERLRDALDAMHAGIVLYDADDRLLLANADFRRLYAAPGVAIEAGASFEDLLRSRVAAGLVPEAIGRETAWIAERTAAHRAGSGGSFLREMGDGRWRRITEQRLADGSSLGFSIDVTELVAQQRELDAAHRLLEDAIEALPEGFALYDRDDRLVLCNQRYREVYADSAPAMNKGASFESIVRHGLERGQYPQAGATDSERAAWLAERVRRHRHPDGVPILQQLQGDRWLRIDERPTRAGGVAGVRTDVTELVRARHELERLATTDALTGLANRRRFDERLAEELQRARRHATSLALLLVDVDHFKRYNDRHGHPQGDRALHAVAAVLAQQARRPGELVARYGGEEFALLLPQADAANAHAVAERCREAMATLALAHGDSPTAAWVTLSIGAARWRHDEDAAAFVARADAALYAAKAAGRARCVLAQEPA